MARKTIAFILLLTMLVAACQPAIHESSKDNEEILNTYYSLSPQAQKRYYVQSDELTTKVPERLVELDELTIGCFGPQKVLGMSKEEGNLGGQCCGTLTSHEAYEAQLHAIEQFIAENGNLDFIPRDPYDTPITVAQELTGWDAEYVLSPEQQATYDNAVEMSHHGGPCCCKCWKWYVMSGLAKKLIVDHNWSAVQVAELWDVSSSCGHAEDTDMYRHYARHDAGGMH